MTRLSPAPHHHYVARTIDPPQQTDLPPDIRFLQARGPFDRTADLMRRLTEADVPPRVAYLVLQRAAAERFLGTPRGTLVAALLAPWFALRIEHRFAPGDFAPRPAVDIVLLRLQKRAPPLVPIRDESLYRDLVVACFVDRRSLLDKWVTPQSLTFEEWLDLYRRFRKLPRAVRRSVSGAEARLRLQQRSLRKTHRTRAPRDALGASRYVMAFAVLRNASASRAISRTISPAGLMSWIRATDWPAHSDASS